MHLPPVFKDIYIKIFISGGASGKKSEVKMLVTQSCPALCDSMDRGAGWATVHEVFSRPEYWQEYWSGLPFPSPRESS